MAAHMGEFAKNHMKRHGWKSGNGLGKNEDGISEAIKVKIKRDSAGVGHDAAEQFTFHWWDHVFNKAASNITVKNNKDGVEVHKKNEGSHTISNEKPIKPYGKKETLYGMFVKSATLTTEGEKAVSSSSDDEELPIIDFSSGLADDELFKACGGRTAHKGARHGLKASAKLQRLQDQERSIEAKGRVEEDEPVDIKDKNSSRKKKKKKKSKKTEDVEYSEDDVKIQKKKKKQKDNMSNEEDMEDLASNSVEENKDLKRKKRKYSKEIVNELENDDESLPEDNVNATKKKKKKKRKKEDIGE